MFRWRGFADSARSIGGAGLDRLGFLASDDVIERLRGFDSIVSWYGANRPDFRELTRGLGLPITFLAALPDGQDHAVDFYNRQAVALGAGRASRFSRYKVSAGSPSFRGDTSVCRQQGEAGSHGMVSKSSGTVLPRHACLLALRAGRRSGRSHSAARSL